MSQGHTEQRGEPVGHAEDHEPSGGAPITVLELDPLGVIVRAAGAVSELVGLPPAALVGRSLRDLLAPGDTARFRLPEPDASTTIEVTIAAKPAGADHDVRVRMQLAWPPDAQGDRVVCFVEPIDVGRRPSSYRDGRAYAAVLRNIGDVISICDEHGLILRSLGHEDELLGWPSARWVGHRLDDVPELVDPDEARAVFDRLLASPGVPTTGELRTRDRSGRRAWLEFTGINLLHEPTIGAVVFITRDVTAKKEAEALQRSQAEIFELIACAAPLDLVLTRLAQMVEEHTRNARTGVLLRDGDRLRLGAGPRLDDELVGAIEGGSPPEWLPSVREALLHNRTAFVPDLTAAEPSDGRRALLDAGVGAAVALPVLDAPDHGAPCGALVVLLDEARLLDGGELAIVTNAARLTAIAMQRHRAEQQLDHLAHHDRLTGLPNRVLVESRLDEGIRLARTHSASIAAMFLDLDNFKIVNDSLGHAAGDHILIGFAERLSKLVRPGDIVGRFGGDEFVVLLENVASAVDATTVAERLLDDLRRPFHIGERNVFLTVSVGIAVSQHGRDPGEVLLRNADSAMYQAKARGRSRIEVYDEQLPERAARRLQLEGDLHAALDAGQFTLYWQPKVSLSTGRIVSAEALLRWRHPERGLILPVDFIPVTEELELITRIGEWVLDEAIRERAGWEVEHGAEAPWSIAVNVSALQLSAPRATETVLRVLSRWQWPPDRLVLELTESVLMDEVANAHSMLVRLKQLGVQLAIDDFGTGYSSLSYLHRFPVDQVKLDRAFVTNIRADGEGSPIARAVINMAHALDISVTAEGVETREQLAGLQRLGCDRAQGYVFARPMTAEAFSALLHERPRYSIVTTPQNGAAASSGQ